LLAPRRVAQLVCVLPGNHHCLLRQIVSSIRCTGNPGAKPDKVRSFGKEYGLDMTLFIDHCLHWFSLPV
jgi:hypothetical protein